MEGWKSDWGISKGKIVNNKTRLQKYIITENQKGGSRDWSLLLILESIFSFFNILDIF